MQLNIFNLFSRELEEQWCEFEAETAWSPFQSYGWISHWQKTVGKPLHFIIPQIVVLRKGKVLIGILPMGIRKNNGIKVLEWLGGIHSDYMGPLLKSDYQLYFDDFQTVWKSILELIDSFDVIHFQRQPKSIGLVENPFVFNFQVEQSDLAYQAEHIGGWEKFQESKIGKKLRADSKRQIRRLNEIGKVEFKIAKSLAEEAEVIKNMIIQKRQRYVDTGLTDKLAIKEHQDFYRGLVGIEMGNYYLSCAYIKVDNVIISTHVGIVSDQCFFYLMPANDNKIWKPFSSGRLLLEYLMKWSLDLNIKIFDFTVGGEDYKKKWCNKEIKLFEYIETFNIKGVVYSFVRSLSKIAKQNPKIWSFLKKMQATLKRNEITFLF